MRLILLIAAVVLFIIAAVIGFGITSGDYNGFLASGLACLAVATLPIDGWPGRPVA